MLISSLVLLSSVTGLSLWGSIVSVGVVVTFYTSLVSLHCSHTSIQRFSYKKPFRNTIYMFLVASIIIIVNMLNYKYTFCEKHKITIKRHTDVWIKQQLNKPWSLKMKHTVYLQGGLRAVLWTDTFQTFVVVGGLIGIIVMGCNRLGGMGEVWRISQEGQRIQFFE